MHKKEVKKRKKKKEYKNWTNIVLETTLNSD
jgi:hypothetical protein